MSQGHRASAGHWSWLLNRAIGAWDERVAEARSLAAAVRVLLPHTRGQRAALETRLNETLTEFPAQPSPLDEDASPLSPAEDALQAFGRVVALEEAARAVLAAVAAEAPWARLTASADLRRAARDVLPYTGEQQARLTTRLDEAATRLLEATPAWWKANGTKLITVADVQAALRGLAGDEAAQVEVAADGFEDVVAGVAAAANETGERLSRLREMARPHARGIAHRPLALELNAIPVVTDWADLRADTGAGAPAAAAEMAAAVTERVELQPSVQRAQDAIRNVFATAIEEWQPRRTAALRLAERARELLEEAGERRDELGVGLDRAYRAVSAVQLPARPGTLEQLEAAAPVLATVTARTALLEASIGAVLTVTIDQPIRETAEAIASLSAEALRLLPYVGDQQAALDQRLREAQPSSDLPPLLAPRPARQESVTDVSSARVTLGRLLDSLREFNAVVAILLAEWEPRVAAVTDLAEQARALLDLAGDQLPDGRGEALARELEEAERNVAGQRPDLPALAPIAEMDMVRQALASVTAVETAISGVLAEVRSLPATRVALAPGLAGAVRALLQRIPAEHLASAASATRRPAAQEPPDQESHTHHRQAEPEDAVAAQAGPKPSAAGGAPAGQDGALQRGISAAAPVPRDRPGGQPATAERGRGSGQQASAVVSPVTELEAAEILARAARELLPRTGTSQTELAARLGEAARQLGGGPGQVGAAVREVGQATMAVLSAANDLARGQAQDIADLAGIAEDLLPYTGRATRTV